MYYPTQRYSSELAQIYRQAMLPESAIGNIQVEVGQLVDVRDAVARGMIPARHVIVDAAKELGIRPNQVTERMLVNLRGRVEEGQAIAGQDAERGKRVFSPIHGIIIAVDEGRIIIQKTPQLIKLEAGVRGRITEVFAGRGVAIEARGAILQGVWGNDKNIIAIIRWEPEQGGLASINLESLDTTYKNEIVIIRNPLTHAALEIAKIRGFAGIIAPSMSANMIDTVLDVNFAVMLTEGFGNMYLSSAVSHLLGQFNGAQGMLDAAQPQRFAERRAELVINRPATGEVENVTKAVPLAADVKVRLTREPYLGDVGTIVELPSNPVLLENGLRVKCARVELIAGEYVDVPLANLELAGT
ncbi:MAG: hypothetical protein Q9P01_04155 [Anaerolineae bacterium]|nr:hypothetical protein [Anaerolineae bacterium]